MNGLTTLSRMMQRPSAPPQRDGNSPSAPTAPPPNDAHHADLQSGSTDASALAAASAVGNEEAGIISPVAASTGSQPGILQWNMTPPSFGRSARDGGSVQRPPLGPRGGSGQLPPSNTGLALTDATDGTLGQQRINQATAPKPKQVQYDYRYEDTDNMMHELEEFFPYVEMPQLAESEKEFSDDFKADWTESSAAKRKLYMERQLELLEHRAVGVRVQAAKRLFYLVQGNYRFTNGPEHQLHWIIDNAKIFRSCDGVASTMLALRNAGSRHDALAAATDPPLRTSFSVNPAPSGGSLPESLAESGHQMDSVNVEIGIYIGLLYFTVEVFRGDEAFADELMALEPPLPVYLLSTVAGLREKTAKGYPVKKLLLLVWKTLLACLGGLKDCKKAVSLQRELAGLPACKEDFTKASPTGLDHFRKDSSVKYPTFTALPDPEAVPVKKLAEAVHPMPIRANYHSSVEEGLPRAFVEPVAQSQKVTAPTSLPQPGTPAPSPPPTPPMKAKKQQYQTDPTRPFIFPFSRYQGGFGPQRLVPYAIDEAERLYRTHMHVPLSLHQLWQTREEYIREERGLGKSGLIGFSSMPPDDEDEDEFEEDPTWDTYQMEDWRFEQEQESCRQRGDQAGESVVKEKRLSLKRLYRTELLYRSMLPHAQSVVVVLLKLLLATVTSNPASQAPPTAGSPTTLEPPAEAGPNTAPLSLEDVDIARHREITSKAVSAIILLLMKWFKASHVIKMQYFSTLLIDSNCLLLILKMFGLQELMSTIQTKNEWEDHNFFRYSFLHFSPGASSQRPEDQLTGRPKAASTKLAPDGEEIELLGDFSWRGFFCAITFVKILHHLTKQRPARITLLVQYKSTQVLKRMLRVPHPLLQLQILNVIKSQVPFCGRKWRQSNMKTITAIYLNCQPELRDEWLAAADIENDVEDSNAAEAALRSLVRFYHNQHYARYMDSYLPDALHRRSNSLAGVGPYHQDEVPALGAMPALNRTGSDVFPPSKTTLGPLSSPSVDQNMDLDALITGWIYEYEDLIGDLIGHEDRQPWDPKNLPGMTGGKGPVTDRQDPAWTRLDAIMRSRGIASDDALSDSESIVSIGDLRDEARFADSEGDMDRDLALDLPHHRQVTENENTWAHLSPHTLGLLPKSPQERRRSSSGSGRLRPVMPANADWLEETIEDEEELGPMPIQGGTADEEERMNAPVDEVEYAFQV